MSFADFLEDELLDHVFGAAAYTAPATLHIALFTTAPADDGTGGTEVSGNAYARVAVTNNATNFPASSGGAKSNGTVIQFATATGSWGTVLAFGVYDAASGGNLLSVGTLGTSKAVGNGDAPKFPIGDLVITLD